MAISKTALDLAQEVIRTCGRDLPADIALKNLFLKKRGKGARPRSPQPRSGEGAGLPSAETSRAVFNYYRWLGWLGTSTPVADQLHAADDLARRFRKNPADFSDSELISRSLPAWLAAEMELTGPLVRALQAEPVLWIRARKGLGPETARRLRDCEPLGSGRLADALRYNGAQDLHRLPEFHSGDIQIQDVTSQAVGWLCEPKAGETWWDACAGEGGKTLHMSDLMDNKGLIWASDRAEWRLRRLRQRAARAKVFNFRAAEWDGSSRLPTKTRFDGVLVDAPCTGVGTWQRNPHARWTTTPEDVRELTGIQLDLLAHAAGSLKPGGRLVYSVCTLTRSETASVADEFERRFPSFKPLPRPNPLAPNSTPAARHWFLPQDHRGNGMFVAVWQVTSEQKSA